MARAWVPTAVACTLYVNSPGQPAYRTRPVHRPPDLGDGTNGCREGEGDEAPFAGRVLWLVACSFRPLAAAV
jgi:hypothetical protein